MHIHVVGLGAVGSFVAFHLRRTLAPKHAVIALHRKQSAPAIVQRPHGWSVLLDADGVTHTQDGILHLSYSMFNNMQKGPGPLECLVVATKAYAVPAVMWALREYISRDTTIVLLHNGMGVYEHLVRNVFDMPPDRPNFILCTNTHGLWRKDPLHVVQTGVGEIQLGIAPDPQGRDYEAVLAQARPGSYTELSLDDIANPADLNSSNTRYINLRNTITALTSARALGATWRPFQEVQTAMRRKLVVNAFVNPISGLLQCKNGDVLKPPNGRWVMKRICEEGETVFRAQLDSENKGRHGAYLELVKNRIGDEPPLEPPTPHPFPHGLTASSLQTEVERIVEQTKNNYSSMYHDLKHNEVTEIEYINGHIRGLAHLYGKSALVNETLYQLVKMRSAYPFAAKPS
ncbi:ketopantoate reductase PanE/ApbA C terminal-domain-containing protein [Earliella scabrosa]|nr:ketopantoate reductase PanE/ApbA C terminal-domain-containing protein [Earliella scabrosa]